MSGLVEPTATATPVKRLWANGRRFWPHVVLALLILLFFNRMAFSNLILARGDTFLYFYPYWEAAADALRAGRIPLWNPDLFMGAPFLANSQVGLLYPLNWPLWWWLPIPTAVKVTILGHLFIAGWGAYVAGRRALRLGRSAALVTALLFALGGYLTAQVEHVNQLQGLAWMPWVFATLARCGDENSRRSVAGRAAVRFALFFALQLLAGHAQTSFITGIGLLVWFAAEMTARRLTANGSHALRFMFHGRRLRRHAPLAIAAGGALALLITSAQLLPTLELVQHSGRQGGLAANEALSFSLNPLLITRALLPHYGQSLFSEYLAMIPITALVLAVLGCWQWRSWPGVLPAFSLVAVALFLALGQFNPVNWALVRLPAFDSFRVPARWLALYALGVSMLAGLGWQVILDRWQLHSRRWQNVPDRARENLWHVERPIRVALLLVSLLMAWGVIANILAIFVPTGAEAPFEAANPVTAVAWLAELLAVVILVTGQRVAITIRGGVQVRTWRGRLGSPTILAALSLLVLFASSRTHPYNNLTAPEAYFDIRPSLARLMAETNCPASRTDCPRPAGRFLSMSDIFFDPGDQAEIDSIYADQLPAEALYDYTIAVKQKEIIAPNLPLAFGLSSVDGFDGGILPLRTYSLAMQLVLPEGEQTADGRLREFLPAVPEARWLDLFNARFLLTDKVADVWRSDVFFDMQHPVELVEGMIIEIGYLPAFEATELRLLASAPPGTVEIQSAEGSAWQLTPLPMKDDLYVARFPEPAEARSITLSTCLSAPSTPCQLMGLSLVDGRDGTFHPLVPGSYRLIHSGDVKIYENLDVLPRAFLLFDWQWRPTVDDALVAMQATGFDPRRTAVLLGDGKADAGDYKPGADEPVVTVTRYQPEQVLVRTETDREGFLILTDAYYPGWRATVDGTKANIDQADAMFRGVFVPAGEHEVEFTFHSPTFERGRIMSLVGLAIWLLLWLVTQMWRR